VESIRWSLGWEPRSKRWEQFSSLRSDLIIPRKSGFGVCLPKSAGGGDGATLTLMEALFHRCELAP
jgi:hypothetical protein